MELLQMRKYIYYYNTQMTQGTCTSCFARSCWWILGIHKFMEVAWPEEVKEDDIGRLRDAGKNPGGA